MKYEGIVTLKKITPQGMEYIGIIEEMPLPMHINIPGVNDLQPGGKIIIEILRVGEKETESAMEPEPTAKPTKIRALINKARGKALR